MQKTLLVLSLLTVLLAFRLGPHETEPLKARVPAYIGMGYHALKGNPYTNHVDEGFRSPIFALTYNKGETTEDGQFQIPDFTTSAQTVACNMNSKVKTFSGTENYQKELSNMASFDTKFDALVMSMKFAFSFGFRSFVNNTVSKNMSSVQTNAECTVYSVEMPIYSNEMQLSNDFILGVKRSFESNDWDEFLEHFGSHYATKVTFGGRYYLQHTYSEESMSLFKSLKIDMSMAAQIQFLMAASVSISDEYKKYTNQTKVVNNKVETTTISTVGGLPPSSGNWVDWVNTVKANLAPVSYRFAAITVLFNYIPGLDAAAAIKSFSDYFNSYCGRNVCPPITPDRPDPRPLVVSLSKGPQISGPAKSTIRFDTNDGQIGVGMRINRISMGFTGNFESFQFILSDGLSQHALPHVGSTPMTKTYVVPAEDEIKCIRFGVHNAVNSTTHMRISTVQFATRKGAESQVYKGNLAATQVKILCLQNSDDHVIGFFGAWSNENKTPDSIGLNFMKEILQ